MTMLARYGWWVRRNPPRGYRAVTHRWQRMMARAVRRED